MAGPIRSDVIDFVDDVAGGTRQPVAGDGYPLGVNRFLKVFGIDPVDIQRTAVAQYTLPLFPGQP